MKYKELCIKREVLANELLRLEQINTTLTNESNKAAQRLSKYVTEMSSPKTVLDLRQASNYKDEYDRLIDLFETQMTALRERKKRKLLCEMTESKANSLIKETEMLNGKIELIHQKMNDKKKKDSVYIASLENAKREIKGKLFNFFNENDLDLTVPLSDVVSYVKNEDPVIQLRNFNKLQKSLEMKNLEDLADSAFVEETREKEIFKW